MRNFWLVLLLASLWGVSAMAAEPCADACSGAESLARWAGLYEEEIISADGLQKKMAAHEKFLLLDARSQKSYYEAHIEGAKLPLAKSYYKQEEAFSQGKIKKLPNTDDALREGMRGYSRGIPIVTYCNDHCQASAVLLFNLKKLGFTHVQAMEEGIQTWQTKGYPVVTGPKAKTR